MTAFLAVVRRDLLLAYRDGAGTWTVLGFFVIAVAVFPLGLGPEPQLLARVAAGVVWAMALLAALLSLDTLFDADWRDGSLELLLSGELAPEALVLAKALAHWLASGLPLIVVAPLAGVLLHLPGNAAPTLAVSLLLGTPALSLLGALGAALALGARRGAALLAVMVLPLAVPVLIFGAGAVESAMLGLAAGPGLLILGGIALMALAVCPFAAAAALRQAVE
ncbi:heme exporter protein CcmB [Oleispirillum naphthae]|uniref:heme exporter protein CcmB n=1 Tax=Oleispirillum naphthae TaxID=2838853 RepID=UPI0030823588